MTFEQHIEEARKLYEKENPNRRLLICHMPVSENFLRDPSVVHTLPRFIADEVAVAAELATKKLLEEYHG